MLSITSFSGAPPRFPRRVHAGTHAPNRERLAARLHLSFGHQELGHRPVELLLVRHTDFSAWRTARSLSYLGLCPNLRVPTNGHPTRNHVSTRLEKLDQPRGWTVI